MNILPVPPPLHTDHRDLHIPEIIHDEAVRARTDQRGECARDNHAPTAAPSHRKCMLRHITKTQEHTFLARGIVRREEEWLIPAQ